MLSTDNPHQLEYQNKLLKIAVLGGIRIEGLDRMRVTLKIETVETGYPPVRHNLDLYNDTQVEKLIRKTATKLETGTSIIEASLYELIEFLEKYRLEQLKALDTQPETKQLTESEVQAAQALLTSENLLQTTNDLIGQSGIIGEETNRLIMYLIFSSRKREQPLHIISLGSSGTGKTHLQESIGHLIPEEEKTEITHLSENAFYYFGRRELKHKLILIEDLDGAENALYPIRELQSKKKISKTIAFKNTKGETKTAHLTVEGPVCIAGCTTQESIYEDNANRSFLIYLDESQQQDKKIMDYQRKVSAGKIDIEQQIRARQVLQNSQRLLENIKVVNPYAESLELPKEVLKPRRTNTHYLQFIELITWYHQHQRERKHDKETGEEFIETTIGDIKNANRLIKEVLIRKSDILSGNSRNQFESLKQQLKNKGEPFTNSHVRNLLKVAKTTAQRYLNNWQDAGVVKKVHDKETQTHYYQVTGSHQYKNLEKQIDTVLNQVIAAIGNRDTLSLSKRPTEPPPNHKQNGSVKTRQVKEKA